MNIEEQLKKSYELGRQAYLTRTAITGVSCAPCQDSEFMALPFWIESPQIGSSTAFSTQWSKGYHIEANIECDKTLESLGLKF